MISDDTHDGGSLLAPKRLRSDSSLIISTSNSNDTKFQILRKKRPSIFDSQHHLKLNKLIDYVNELEANLEYAQLENLKLNNYWSKEMEKIQHKLNCKEYIDKQLNSLNENFNKLKQNVCTLNSENQHLKEHISSLEANLNAKNEENLMSTRQLEQYDKLLREAHIKVNKKEAYLAKYRLDYKHLKYENDQKCEELSQRNQEETKIKTAIEAIIDNYNIIRNHLLVSIQNDNKTSINEEEKAMEKAISDLKTTNFYKK